MFIKKTILGLSVAAVLALGSTAWAESVNIDGADPSQWDQYTEFSNGLYTFAKGNDYTFVNYFNYSVYGVVFNSEGNTFTVDNSDVAGNVPKMTIQSFTLNNGTVAATGADEMEGSTGGSAIVITENIYQTGGMMNANGGGNVQAHGLEIGGRYVFTGGTIDADGGTAVGATGIYANIFESSGSGTIHTQGGTNIDTSGIKAENEFVHSGSGAITALGGYLESENPAAGSGISVGSIDYSNPDNIIKKGNFIHSGTGQILATGGGNTNASGIWTGNDFTNTGSGAITAKSGGSNNAYGIFVGNDFYTSTGSITAIAGSGPSSAIYVGGSFNQTGGYVEANAGSGNSMGIEIRHNYVMDGADSKLVAIANNGTSSTIIVNAGVAVGGKLVQKNGSIEAYGNDKITPSSSTYAYGIALGIYDDSSLLPEPAAADAGVFEQQGGKLVAKGGMGVKTPANPAEETLAGFTAGIVGNEIIQSGGEIDITGGTGYNAYGAQFDTITQTGILNGAAGKIIARAGTGTNAYGLVTGSYYQAHEEAELEVWGGATEDQVGLYVADELEINGHVSFGSTGFGEAIYVGHVNESNPLDYSGQVYIGSTAVITPIISVTEDNRVYTGKIFSGDTVEITSGATLAPKVYGSLALGVGETVTATFLEAKQLLDGFLLGEEGQISRFFGYTAEKVGNEYEITVGRTNTAANYLTGKVGENTINFLKGVESGLLGANTEDIPKDSALWQFIFEDYTALESEDLTDAEMAAWAGAMQIGYSNHAATRLAPYTLMQLDVVQMAMNREILASQRVPYWQVWVKGVFHNASNIKPETDEFLKGKEDFSGVVVGAAKDFRFVTFAAQAHYLTGTVKSKNVYKADANSFGIIVGARVHDVVNPRGAFNPWFDVNFAYSRQDFDQNRYDFHSRQLKADVKSNMFRVGMTIGNTFRLGDIVTFTPEIGFEYTSISQNSYKEKGDGLALNVGKSTFESFRPKVGAEIGVAVSEVVSAEFRAFYRYETADTHMVLNNSFRDASAVHFKTVGEKVGRSSGNLGVGLNVNFTETVSLGVDYDLWLRNKYTGHQFAVELRVNF